MASPGFRDRVALLREREFLLIWLVGAVSSTVRWLEMLAVGVVVFDLTGSPVQVALMSILRMAPLALLGAIAGAAAERIERQRLLWLGLIAMAAGSLALALLAWRDAIQIWHIAVGVVLSGMFWVLDFPVRRTLLSEIVGPERIGTAMGLDTLTNNGTRMLGPLLGGALLVTVGLDGVYMLGAVLYFGAAIMTLMLRAAGNRRTGLGSGLLVLVADGLRVLRANPIIAGILSVTVIFNIWGFPFLTMVPVLGKDELALDPLSVGILLSAEGAGALIGAVYIAGFGVMRQFRRLYAGGTMFYLIMAFGFAWSAGFVSAGIFLLAAGIGTAAFATMQSTLILLCAPPQARNRMMGLLSVCIGTAPIGFLHIGLLAHWFGVRPAIAISAIEGSIALLWSWRVWPGLLGSQPTGAISSS